MRNGEDESGCFHYIYKADNTGLKATNACPRTEITYQRVSYPYYSLYQKKHLIPIFCGPPPPGGAQIWNLMCVSFWNRLYYTLLRYAFNPSGGMRVVPLCWKHGTDKPRLFSLCSVYHDKMIREREMGKFSITRKKAE